jgi:hypothetical protein
MKASRLLLILPALILPVSAAAGDFPLQLRVTAEVANLRLRPDIGSAVVRQISRDSLILATAKEGDWYLVAVTTETGRTETGYVHESLVSPLSPEGEPKPAEETAAGARTGPPPPAPEKKAAPRESGASLFSRGRLFSVTLAGGLALVQGGDLNRGAQGLAAFFQDSLGADTDDEVVPVRLGCAAGADVVFPLADKVSLGLGAEFLRGSRESKVLLKKGADGYVLTTRPSVWDLPLRAYLDFAPAGVVHLKIGVEYHLAHAGYYYLWETKDGWQEWTGEAGGSGLGVFGGAAVEWALSPSFCLVLDLAGRYAPLSGFSGTGAYLDSGGVSAEEEGKIYYYETRIAGRDPYTLLFIRSRVPSEGGVYNPRAAEIDFTGLALRAGFKVSF